MCVCVCVYRIYVFLPITHSCDDCNLELYPGYISEDPRKIHRRREHHHPGRVSAAVERPRTRDFRLCVRFPTGLPHSDSCEPQTSRTRSTIVRRKIQIVFFYNKNISYKIGKDN